MPRYVLKRFDGSIQNGLSWNKKSHAEAWIQYHAKLFGGIEWRVGGLFKCKRDNQMEVVWSNSRKPVNWYCVEPAPLSEYDPAI